MPAILQLKGHSFDMTFPSYSATKGVEIKISKKVNLKNFINFTLKIEN